MSDPQEQHREAAAIRPTYSPLGRYCDRCQGPLFLADCRVCHIPFPTFGLLGGMRMLAETLLAHYEIDPDDHQAVVAELESAIGEELLDIGRETLAKHGIPIPAEASASPAGRS